ncbi:hypothetical protein RIR_jg3024.t1 [Rhizophagus irregularis DAOM 181602=DAOM 197198]|nr:hypothetical protein RIR_jg3024.t1 [Rhizophagus irregularis DAOM 181602=DAOM 197198]
MFDFKNKKNHKYYKFFKPSFIRNSIQNKQIKFIIRLFPCCRGRENKLIRQKDYSEGSYQISSNQDLFFFFFFEGFIIKRFLYQIFFIYTWISPQKMICYFLLLTKFSSTKVLALL